MGVRGWAWGSIRIWRPDRAAGRFKSSACRCYNPHEVFLRLTVQGQSGRADMLKGCAIRALALKSYFLSSDDQKSGFVLSPCMNFAVLDYKGEIAQPGFGR